MRKLALLVATLFTLAGGLLAAPLTITLDTPNALLTPGTVVTFTGTIVNTTGFDYDLNSVSGNIDDLTLTMDTSPFFLLPLSIAANQTLTGVDLFILTIPDPFANLGTLLNGNYTILGGISDPGAQDIIGATDFTVTVNSPEVPEPSTYATALTALGLLAALRRR